jgi:hypothetical protein
VRRSLGFGVLTIATLVGWAPMASLLTAAMLATLLGCADEPSANPSCVVAGVDIGPILKVMAGAGWLILGVWPLMLLTLLAWCGVLAWMALRRIRRAWAQR